MSQTLIKEVRIVRSSGIVEGDLLIKDGRIAKIGSNITPEGAHRVVDGKGKLLFPGMIDDQVHFREPGLTHKANIKTESAAAVAGGITSFMEMPNTKPAAITQELLQDKYDIAAKVSPANYSFFMGVSNDNLDEALKTDPTKVCGLKIFMGSSTGNMLVDKEEVLEGIFSKSSMLIATHCEDEATIRANSQRAKDQFGDNVPIRQHPIIRSEEACYLSSSKAVELAKKYKANLHILHISTAKEIELFSNLPLEDKHITAEACVHHLWFTDKDYDTKGTHIKWNPAVKKESDRTAIRNAVVNGQIDVLATDHAPHTLEEKSNNYWNAPSGGPLVQHAFVALLELVKQGVFTYELIAEKAAENVAKRFMIDDRGFIEEGNFADLVLVSENSWKVSKENILYKCGWSPFEGENFSHKIEETWVNGNSVYANGKVQFSEPGMRLSFYRK
ncbi:dihydroorotase [Luteibaculum oceani]|uniref:Dihydroorotase n=1 Tax=Luteibaculum oceani TaxID=1294296 RepID=A0A5C6V309_9FLAO|nr:dihydroorotase [Luteibaculum oceani]TXC78896.1 dihydroorotase [Luteibaculum oceani]